MFHTYHTRYTRVRHVHRRRRVLETRNLSLLFAFYLQKGKTPLYSRTKQHCVRTIMLFGARSDITYCSDFNIHTSYRYMLHLFQITNNHTIFIFFLHLNVMDYESRTSRTPVLSRSRAQLRPLNSFSKSIECVWRITTA